MGKKVGRGVQDGGSLMPIHVAVWQKPSQYCKLFGGMALKHVQYHIRNELSVQVRCRIQEAWGWCTGMKNKIEKKKKKKERIEANESKSKRDQREGTKYAPRKKESVDYK